MIGVFFFFFFQTFIGLRFNSWRPDRTSPTIPFHSSFFDLLARFTHRHSAITTRIQPASRIPSRRLACSPAASICLLFGSADCQAPHSFQAGATLLHTAAYNQLQPAAATANCHCSWSLRSFPFLHLSAFTIELLFIPLAGFGGVFLGIYLHHFLLSFFHSFIHSRLMRRRQRL